MVYVVLEFGVSNMASQFLIEEISTTETSSISCSPVADPGGMEANELVESTLAVVYFWYTFFIHV